MKNFWILVLFMSTGAMGAESVCPMLMGEFNQCVAKVAGTGQPVAGGPKAIVVYTGQTQDGVIGYALAQRYEGFSEVIEIAADGKTKKQTAEGAGRVFERFSTATCAARAVRIHALTTEKGVAITDLTLSAYMRDSALVLDQEVSIPAARAGKLRVICQPKPDPRTRNAE